MKSCDLDSWKVVHDLQKMSNSWYFKNKQFQSSKNPLNPPYSPQHPLTYFKVRDFYFCAGFTKNTLKPHFSTNTISKDFLDNKLYFSTLQNPYTPSLQPPQQGLNLKKVVAHPSL